MIVQLFASRSWQPLRSARWVSGKRLQAVVSGVLKNNVADWNFHPRGTLSQRAGNATRPNLSSYKREVLSSMENAGLTTLDSVQLALSGWLS